MTPEQKSDFEEYAKVRSTERVLHVPAGLFSKGLCVEHVQRVYSADDHRVFFNSNICDRLSNWGVVPRESIGIGLFLQIIYPGGNVAV